MKRWTAALLMGIAMCSVHAQLLDDRGQSQDRNQTKQKDEGCYATWDSGAVAPVESGTECCECGQTEAEPRAGRHEFSYEAVTGISTALLFLVTAVLAFFTYRLWRATREVVESAETSEERQARAYVGLRSTKLKKRGDAYTVESKLKNFGHTPAFNMRTDGFWGIRTPPIAVPQFPDRIVIGSSSTTIWPGHTMHMSIQTDIALSEDELAAISREERALVVGGRIVYTDIYGKARETRYMMVLMGADSIARGRLFAHEDGNTAT